MNKVVVPFPKGRKLRSPIAQSCRIGESHVKIGEMHASGHLPLPQAAFEADRGSRAACQGIQYFQANRDAGQGADVDLENPLKRTRLHAETMGKVADALERLHEERGKDSPRARAWDPNVEEVSLPDDERK